MRPRFGDGALTPILVAMVAIHLGGCGGDSETTPREEDGIACTTHLQAGIVITVLDASGAAASCGAQALITEGTYSETVQLPPMLPGCNDSIALSGAFERPGTYRVTVSKPGYQSVLFSNVVVAADVCHVIPVALTASLTP
jgi:hypothetical protein